MPIICAERADISPQAAIRSTFIMRFTSSALSMIAPSMLAIAVTNSSSSSVKLFGTQAYSLRLRRTLSTPSTRSYPTIGAAISPPTLSGGSSS